jgi:hypothetical protein
LLLVSSGDVFSAPDLQGLVPPVALFSFVLVLLGALRRRPDLAVLWALKSVVIGFNPVCETTGLARLLDIIPGRSRAVSET